jgi:hypothetical protein
MRSRRGYWIGCALIVGGAVAAVLWAVLGLHALASTIDDFQRLPAPGTHEITLPASKQVLYDEQPGGRTTAHELFVIELSDAASGAPVPLHRYSASLSYSIHGKAGTAWYSVTAAHAGRYRIKVQAPESPGRRVAIGPSVSGRIVRTLVGTLVLGFGVAGGGLLLMIVTAIRRRAAQRAQKTGSPAPVWPT